MWCGLAFDSLLGFSTRRLCASALFTRSSTALSHKLSSVMCLGAFHSLAPQLPFHSLSSTALSQKLSMMVSIRGRDILSFVSFVGMPWNNTTPIRWILALEFAEYLVPTLLKSSFKSELAFLFISCCIISCPSFFEFSPLAQSKVHSWILFSDSTVPRIPCRIPRSLCRPFT
jgi:hypothetical protein